MRRDDGAQCFSRRPDSRDGRDVASWRTLKKIEASNAIEGGLADRSSMGLAKAGFEAAESRLDDFRFNPDSRWANGWPEMGGGPGGKRGTRPRRTWEDQKTDSTAEAHAGAALKGSEFSGLVYRYLGCMYSIAGNLGTWRLDIQALDSSCS